MLTRFDAMPRYERGLELREGAKATFDERVCESGLGTCLRFLTGTKSPAALRAGAGLAKSAKSEQGWRGWALGDSLRMLTRLTDAMPR
ncbi:hypothetical protein [Candidatus Amarobacter glycogenicus]|uniref:hypothetical protein n=1 Tax=Candidatus Amarobacter glycogenicus TaxID=3140699 RepID=UPI002A177905|nr:hypothetical protein [Dehalococcoidia bacterium]